LKPGRSLNGAAARPAASAADLIAGLPVSFVIAWAMWFNRFHEIPL
jgi:hypothetical protein